MLPAARADVARGREPNPIRVGKAESPAKASPANETEGFRRRGSDDAIVANLFLMRGLLFDASSLPVHMPWKILIPHSTMTMANTSVAAVSTLSKEATLILTLRFPAPLAV